MNDDKLNQFITFTQALKCQPPSIVTRIETHVNLKVISSLLKSGVKSTLFFFFSFMASVSNILFLKENQSVRIQFLFPNIFSENSCVFDLLTKHFGFVH